eukprot:4261079-Amphidinium_carterae.2
MHAELFVRFSEGQAFLAPLPYLSHLDLSYNPLGDVGVLDWRFESRHLPTPHINSAKFQGRGQEEDTRYEKGGVLALVLSSPPHTRVLRGSEYPSS